MDKRKLRTAGACRVANIDRVRLGDVIASGEYSAAPTTSPGVARVFNESDLIALYLFGQFDRGGYPARLAGKIAQEVRDALTIDPNAEFVTVQHNTPDRAHTQPGVHFDPEVTHLSGLPILFTQLFDLRNVRGMVIAMLDDEFNTAGGDE